MFVVSITQIVNLNAALHTISIFEHINLSKEQLIDSKIVQEMQYVHFKTTNEYLKYRLEFLLQKWSNIVNIPPAKKVRSTVSNTVFEAIINDDDKFFETTSVPVLLHRLLKSFDKNYKVHFYNVNHTSKFIYRNIQTSNNFQFIIRLLIWQQF